MRDPRFVAAHRGGTLVRDDHALLARWAADCAEAAMPLFTRFSEDDRPRRALEIARAWAEGAVMTGVAMGASVAAHAAARGVSDPAAVAAARAVAQAVATAHFADHCMGAWLYAGKALVLSGAGAGTEWERRRAALPDHLRGMVSEGIDLRRRAFKLLVGATTRGPIPP